MAGAAVRPFVATRGVVVEMVDGVCADAVMFACGAGVVATVGFTGAGIFALTEGAESRLGGTT